MKVSRIEFYKDFEDRQKNVQDSMNPYIERVSNMCHNS